MGALHLISLGSAPRRLESFRFSKGEGDVRRYLWKKQQHQPSEKDLHEIANCDGGRIVVVPFEMLPQTLLDRFTLLSRMVQEDLMHYARYFAFCPSLTFDHESMEEMLVRGVTFLGSLVVGDLQIQELTRPMIISHLGEELSENMHKIMFLNLQTDSGCGVIPTQGLHFLPGITCSLGKMKIGRLAFWQRTRSILPPRAIMFYGFNYECEAIRKHNANWEEQVVPVLERQRNGQALVAEGRTMLAQYLELAITKRNAIFEQLQRKREHGIFSYSPAIAPDQPLPDTPLIVELAC